MVLCIRQAVRGGDEDRETELKAVNNVSCLMPLNDNTGEQMDDMEDGVWGRILTVMLIEWEKCLCRRFCGYGWNLGGSSGVQQGTNLNHIQSCKDGRTIEEGWGTMVTARGYCW